LIFLKCGISKLKANIQSRDRSFEKNINRKYLISLQKGYKELLKKDISINIKEIDVNKKDFESDENTFESILRTIFRASF
jgi:deoxyadenosine/deoxycytidine kinase